MPLRREPGYGSEYADDFDEDFGQDSGRGRKAGVRLSVSAGLIPKSRWGRIAAGVGLVLLTGAGVAGMLVVQSFLLHDEHFVVEGSSSIQIAGNSHLTRPQLLSVFGGDVERNIFKIPLRSRRAELESLPWVEHATVMRLLPNRVRVAIVERTPVAFVRQGKEIGLVDANGVLLDMDGASGRKVQEYSFPVLTGISASDPLSTRAARMKIYMEFVAALDAGGENISRGLSEVDLSNPEDVKAILPSGGSASTDVLVHFGDGKFLERYHQYQQHLAEWRTQYPRLGSVDMRYERQVVLEMQPGGAAVPAAAASDAKPVEKKAEPIVAKAAAAKPVAVKPAVVVKPVAVAKAKAPVVTSHPVAVAAAPAAPVHHLTKAFDVGPRAKAAVATPVAQGAGR